MKASSLEKGLRVIGRTSDRQSSASAISSATSTRPSERSKTTPPSGTAGRSQTEVHQWRTGVWRVLRFHTLLCRPLKCRTPVPRASSMQRERARRSTFEVFASLVEGLVSLALQYIPDREVNLSSVNNL